MKHSEKALHLPLRIKDPPGFAVSSPYSISHDLDDPSWSVTSLRSQRFSKVVAKALTLFSRAGVSINGEAEGGFWNVGKVVPVPAGYVPWNGSQDSPGLSLTSLQAHIMHTSDTEVLIALSTFGYSERFSHARQTFL